MARVQGLESFKRKVKKLRLAAGPAVEAGLLKAGAIITAEQKRLAPVDRGDVRDSVNYKLTKGAKTGSAAVRIVAADPASRHAEFGTAPHNIRPKDAEALSVGPGAFAEEVDHPGNTAQPFFFPGYRASRRRARAAISKGIREQVRKAVT